MMEQVTNNITQTIQLSITNSLKSFFQNPNMNLSNNKSQPTLANSQNINPPNLNNNIPLPNMNNSEYFNTQNPLALFNNLPAPPNLPKSNAVSAQSKPQPTMPNSNQHNG